MVTVNSWQFPWLDGEIEIVSLIRYKSYAFLGWELPPSLDEADSQTDLSGFYAQASVSTEAALHSVLPVECKLSLNFNLRYKEMLSSCKPNVWIKSTCAHTFDQ